MKRTENELIWNILVKESTPNEDLKQVALDLFEKYGRESHDLGNLLIALVVNKGKFEPRKRKIRDDKFGQRYMDPGRSQSPTSGW